MSEALLAVKKARQKLGEKPKSNLGLPLRYLGRSERLGWVQQAAREEQAAADPALVSSASAGDIRPTEGGRNS